VTTVFVAGALANRPSNGGGAAVRVDWVRGLERLGCEVWFVEQIARGSLIGDDGGTAATAPGRSIQGSFFLRVTREAGIAARSALLDERGRVLAGGAAADDLAAAAAGADLLVNISGHLTLPSLLRRFRRRAYVDLDPGFTQLWHARGESGARLAGHDGYFTVGLAVGSRHSLPPPVVLDDWPVHAGELAVFTTVASWRSGFGRIAHQGRTFGLKAHEFRKLLDLPARVPATLELALDIHPGDAADLAALRAHGWRVVDPRRVAGDPRSYREYIQRSGAELSVAQGIYVDLRSGWVSDRTARYLASGKPALVQDTGVAAALPVGEGLLTFRTVDEAAAGAAAIAADYARHSRRAREVAERCFDSDRVLGHLLNRMGVDA
jgi:hypothetical protein